MFEYIKSFANYLSYDLLGITRDTHLADAVNFFIYDSIKIILLLLIITQIMSFINALIPVEKIRDFLSKKKLYGFEYFFASFFGSITPFCSCSSIPLFIGFLKGGIPLGVTFAFLITSPLVNEVAIAVLLGVFGLKTTIIYVSSGIFLGMFGGYIIGKLKLENYVADFIHKINSNYSQSKNIKKSLKDIWKESSREGIKITKKIIPYVLIGVGVGGFIHGYIPSGFFEEYLKKDNPFTVPISVILGIPIYANATSVIPIVQSLVDKGVPLGTGLAFMMAVVGLSLPEFLILKKVMKTRLLFTFFGLVGAFIIMLGYFFNLVL